MKSFFFLLITCLSTSFLSEGYAQAEHQSGSFSDIDFIEGRWKATAGDNTVYATWSAPEGNTRVGYVRVIKEGKVTLYEFFAFEQTEEGLIALVKHFRPGLIGLEEKDKSDRYQFLEARDNGAYFKKDGEDVRVLYEKRGDDQFAIAIGKPQGSKWVYKDFWVFNKE
ncbi:DUF6265 family protein [Antarcticibacterium sp. 1MA-6-2]|uniref:DUF6265 family protein n=1 Tax=Antarcticibacterium sp. 1MA-6-2 TaxID=2908210 RepID=UPI001F157E57|nr:DUF6265 family protein [Antarcticibacterium sp. 1MA-6-2]UJH90334.1 DUF6265 family protein [Antarcticibacterium sp. 1MA-6-2]